MNVLLINPNINMPIAVRTSPPLGLAYLAAVSEHAGYNVRVLDMQVDDTSFETLFAEFPPDVVGFTANTPQVKSAWAVAEKIKQMHSCPIVIGGPHPSVLPEESLKRSRVDIVGRGEGESTWLEILQIVAKTPRNDSAKLADNLAGVKGVSYRSRTGEFVHNPERPPIPGNLYRKSKDGLRFIHEDVLNAGGLTLDNMPYPAYHLFPATGYTSLQPVIDHGKKDIKSFSMLTSRGCPYRCTYCSQSTFPEKWRARSVDSVVEEFRHVTRMGASEIGMVDDSFNIDRQRVIDVCNALVDEGLNKVPWIMINGIRSNLADPELLGAMHRAGCKRVAFAPETGDEFVLQKINKKHSMAQVRDAFKNAKAVGLETIGFFMIGLPDDTEQTIEDTIRLAVDLDPDVANFSMTTPFPGTILYNEVLEKGKLLMDDWDDYIFLEGKARYEMGLSADIMEAKWHEAYRRFYLRPRRIAKTLARRSTWTQLPRLANMAIRMAMPHQSQKQSTNAEAAC